MENTSRHVFGLNGVTGMLIATVLLLSILAGLVYLSIVTQQAVADKPYKLENLSNVEKFSTTDKAKEVMVVKE